MDEIGTEADYNNYWETTRFYEELDRSVSILAEDLVVVNLTPPLVSFNIAFHFYPFA